jgi:hypothetical protein
MLPPPTGCEPPAGRRWAVIALAHFELVVQTSRPRGLSWEAVVRGRSGTVTAQPASMMAPAAKIANVKVFELVAIAARGDAIIASRILAFACSLVAAA